MSKKINLEEITIAANAVAKEKKDDRYSRFLNGPYKTHYLEVIERDLFGSYPEEGGYPTYDPFLEEMFFNEDAEGRIGLLHTVIYDMPEKELETIDMHAFQAVIDSLEDEEDEYQDIPF